MRFSLGSLAIVGSIVVAAGVTALLVAGVLVSDWSDFALFGAAPGWAVAVVTTVGMRRLQRRVEDLSGQVGDLNARIDHVEPVANVMAAAMFR